MASFWSGIFRPSPKTSVVCIISSRNSLRFGICLLDRFFLLVELYFQVEYPSGVVMPLRPPQQALSLPSCTGIPGELRADVCKNGANGCSGSHAATGSAGKEEACYLIALFC